MRGDRSSVALVVVLSCCVLACASQWYRTYRANRAWQEKIEAESRLQQQIQALTMAALFYAQDHKERFPNADRWLEQIGPYLTASAKRPDPRIAMNRALSEKTNKEIYGSTEAILFFESTRGPAADLDAIPLSTPTRTFAVSFADGHGYPRGLSDRDKLIERSKQALIAKPR